MKTKIDKNSKEYREEAQESAIRILDNLRKEYEFFITETSGEIFSSFYLGILSYIKIEYDNELDYWDMLGGFMELTRKEGHIWFNGGFNSAGGIDIVSFSELDNAEYLFLLNFDPCIFEGKRNFHRRAGKLKEGERLPFFEKIYEGYLEEEEEEGLKIKKNDYPSYKWTEFYIKPDFVDGRVIENSTQLRVILDKDKYNLIVDRLGGSEKLYRLPFIIQGFYIERDFSQSYLLARNISVSKRWF